jgi:hypothetical protein
MVYISFQNIHDDTAQPDMMWEFLSVTPGERSGSPLKHANLFSKSSTLTVYGLLSVSFTSTDLKHCICFCHSRCAALQY